MSLKILNVEIQSTDSFLNSAFEELRGKSKFKENTITFDSVEAYKKTLTFNREYLLKIVARKSPESINQLATLLDRPYAHVHADCKTLELSGFLKLEEYSGKAQFAPRLAFDYDAIKINLDNITDVIIISDKAFNDFIGSVTIQIPEKSHSVQEHSLHYTDNKKKVITAK